MRVMYCCLAALLPALASARVYDLERDFGAVPYSPLKPDTVRCSGLHAPAQ